MSTPRCDHIHRCLLWPPKRENFSQATGLVPSISQFSRSTVTRLPYQINAPRERSGNSAPKNENAHEANFDFCLGFAGIALDEG